MTPRRIGGVLVTTLAIGLLLPGSGFPRASSAPALVAIQYDGDAASLVRVDPLTLAHVDGAAVALDRDTGSFMLSPDGTEAAFGSSGTTTLHLYDLRRMQARPSFAVAHGPGSVWVVAWPAPDRLLALVQSCCSTHAFLESIDPEAARVVRRTAINGDVRDEAAIPGGAVLLVARPNAIGPTRLAIVTTSGAVRWVRVARVQVGFKPKPSVARGSQAEPGLAVDAAGQRIFLVQAHGPTAEIALSDLSVSYHTIRRLAAVEKEFRGPWRFAQYLGDGMLAVSGFDGMRSSSGFSFTPAGLMLIDTSDWSERTVDGATSWFTFAASNLLVLEGQNLRAYSQQGQLHFQLPVAQPLGSLAAIGPYAYVWLADNRIDVIDLAAGKLVQTTAPMSLTPLAVAPQS